MKKLIILLLTLVTGLCSCGRAEAPTHPIQLTFPMEAEAHLQCDGGNARVVITYASEGQYTVRYTEPQVMTGITYGVDDKGEYMSFGESRIPVTRGDACFASLAVGRLLCPRKEDTVTVEYEKGLPIRAEGTVDGFKLTLSEIKIEFNSQGK